VNLVYPRRGGSLPLRGHRRPRDLGGVLPETISGRLRRCTPRASRSGWRPTGRRDKDDGWTRGCGRRQWDSRHRGRDRSSVVISRVAESCTVEAMLTPVFLSADALRGGGGPGRALRGAGRLISGCRFPTAMQAAAPADAGGMPCRPAGRNGSHLSQVRRREGIALMMISRRPRASFRWQGA